MNRYFNYLITGAAAITLFAACNGMDGELDGGGTAVLFTAGNIAAVQTRTAIGASGETQWVLNDPVGIFMTGAATADNRKYTVSNVASGALAPDGAGNTLAFPQSGSVDFIAYYPWKNGQTLGNYPVDVSNQSVPAAIDLLYSNNATGKDKSSNPVNLAFNHVLAKLAMTVQKGAGIANLTGLSAKVKGMNTQTAFNLSNGSFGAASAPQDITPLCTQTPSATANGLYEAILLPAAATTGATVEFTLNGETYIWNLSASLPALAGGNRYGFTVTVNKTGITVSPVSITDWTINDNGAVDMEEIGKGIAKVRIPAGTFLMGSSDGSNIGDGNGSGLNTTPAEPNRFDDETQHQVTLTKDFYMSKYPITNAQYAAFLNANNIRSNGLWASGSYPTERLIFANVLGIVYWGLNWDGGNSKWVPVSGYDNHPVIFVTWYGADEYARWVGGSLPTEAQWEYACRAGTTTPWATATGVESGLEDYAWYVDNSGGSTHVVGGKKPNGYGLYDMHGNVSEWCSDWFDYYYGSGPVTDPTGPPDPVWDSERVLRGGGYDSEARFCRSAFRYGEDSNIFLFNIGFRVVFVP